MPHTSTLTRTPRSRLVFVTNSASTNYGTFATDTGTHAISAFGLSRTSFTTSAIPMSPLASAFLILRPVWLNRHLPSLRLLLRLFIPLQLRQGHDSIHDSSTPALRSAPSTQTKTVMSSTVQPNVRGLEPSHHLHLRIICMSFSL